MLLCDKKIIIFISIDLSSEIVQFGVLNVTEMQVFVVSTYII